MVPAGFEPAIPASERFAVTGPLYTMYRVFYFETFITIEVSEIQ